VTDADHAVWGRKVDFSGGGLPISVAMSDVLTFRRSSDGIHGPSWLRVAAALLAVAAGLQALGQAPAPPGLPELVRTKHRAFAIPFRIPKSEDPDADAAGRCQDREVHR
jgi:hypothetical protein